MIIVYGVIIVTAVAYIVVLVVFVSLYEGTSTNVVLSGLRTSFLYLTQYLMLRFKNKKIFY
jgi:hypothetical protein